MYRSRYDWTPDFRAQEIPLDVTEVMSTSRNMGSFISESVEEEVFLLKAYVTGTSFVKDFYDIIEDLKEGDKVQLVREPDNSYDSKAIRVSNEKGEKMGYIPKEMNKDLSKVMDAGIPVIAEIGSLYYDKIVLDISMVFSGPMVEWKFADVSDLCFSDNLPAYGPMFKDYKFIDMTGPVKELDFNRCLSNDDRRLLRWGHGAYSMDDRWNMCYDDGILCLYRSWTGKCIYKVLLGKNCKHRLIVNMDKNDWMPPSDEKILEDVDRLLDYCLKDQLVPVYVHQMNEGTMLIRPPMINFEE